MPRLLWGQHAFTILIYNRGAQGAVRGFRSSYTPRLRRLTSKNAIAHCGTPQPDVTNFTFASSTHRSYANDPMPEELRADAITMRYIKWKCFFSALPTQHEPHRSTAYRARMYVVLLTADVCSIHHNRAYFKISPGPFFFLTFWLFYWTKISDPTAVAVQCTIKPQSRPPRDFRTECAFLMNHAVDIFSTYTCCFDAVESRTLKTADSCAFKTSKPLL